MVDVEVLKQAVMDSRDGIIIADATLPDMPLIFVNSAFERITGYGQDEVVGQNCRFLQRGKADESTLAPARRALAAGRGCSLTVRNYRRDGRPFWNELSLSPIHADNGDLTHFVGLQKDITERRSSENRIRVQNRDLTKANTALERLVVVDALTGVYNRRHFDERLELLWKIAMRDEAPLALFFIDIDHFKQYNDRLGHAQGDRALVAVANMLAGNFQRGSDFLARYGGEEFVVVANGMARAPATALAERLCEQVRSLNIPHPDTTPGGQLTISVGYVAAMPRPGMSAVDMLESADQAMFKAKDSGRNCAVGAAV